MLLQRLFNQKMILIRSISKLFLMIIILHMKVEFLAKESQALLFQCKILNLNTQHIAWNYQKNLIELCLEIKLMLVINNHQMKATKEYINRENNIKIAQFQNRTQWTLLKNCKKLKNNLKDKNQKTISFIIWKIFKGLIIPIWTQLYHAIQQVS